MSHLRVKTSYNTEGTYGSTDKKIIYCHHNNSADYVTFYNEEGEILLVVPDTIDNNILDAINRLYVPVNNDGDKQKLKEGIEHMTTEDMLKCGLMQSKNETK